ncbi:MAG: hypothetical protein ACP5LN_10930 [Thermoproteota archaeon]
MKNWKGKLVKALEKAGKPSQRGIEPLKFDLDFQIDNKEELLKNTYKGIKFFVGETFWQGRGDWLSDVYRRAFFRAFDEVYREEDFSTKLFVEKVQKLCEKFEQKVGEVKKKSGEPFKINKRDSRRLKAIFSDFLPKLGEYQFNPMKLIVEEIKKGNAHKLFEERLNFYGIGPKVRALILRGVVQNFDLEEYVKKDKKSLKFLFPVDTHVRQTIQMLWEETKGKSDEELIEFAVKKCEELKVSPLNFNSGCWALGFKAQDAFDILINRIEELERSK